MKLFSILILSVALLFTTSCTRQINPNIYQAGAVGEASQAYRGTIIGLRSVHIDESERLSQNTMGGGLGAVAGGVLGSQIGGGKKAHVIGALAGALAGGMGGAYLQDKMGHQEGIEYTVELKNGKIMTVVQGPENVYAIEQPILVIISNKGRSRIIPAPTNGESLTKRQTKKECKERKKGKK